MALELDVITFRDELTLKGPPSSGVLMYAYNGQLYCTGATGGAINVGSLAYSNMTVSSTLNVSGLSTLSTLLVNGQSTLGGPTTTNAITINGQAVHSTTALATGQAALSILGTQTVTTGTNQLLMQAVFANSTTPALSHRAFLILPTVTGSSNIANLSGGFFRCDLLAGYSGVVTSAIGLQIAPPTIAGGSITNSIGLQVSSGGGTSINRAIQVDAGVVFFQEAVNLAVGTTTGSQIGTSPTMKLGFLGLLRLFSLPIQRILGSAMINLGLLATGGFLLLIGCGTLITGTHKGDC